MGRLTNADLDDLVQSEYEDALANGEPWAEDAYRYRFPEEEIHDQDTDL